MSGDSIDLDGAFADIIVNDTQEVINEDEQALRHNTHEAGAEARRLLQKNSRRSKMHHKHYADDWHVRDEIEPEGVSTTVYNAKHYQLTHLLEKGHAKANGGRVAGDHVIAKTYEQVAQKFGKGGR